MAGDQLNTLKADSFSQLDKRSKSATLLHNLKYLVGKEMSKVGEILNAHKFLGRKKDKYFTYNFGEIMGRIAALLVDLQG